MHIFDEILAPEVDGQVSENVVMSSNAGYYVGNAYFDKDFGMWLPNARISGYYKTEKSARIELLYDQLAEAQDEEQIERVREIRQKINDLKGVVLK